jgi:quercetin dioxygenase-like cupin family protein
VPETPYFPLHAAACGPATFRRGIAASLVGTTLPVPNFRIIPTLSAPSEVRRVPKPWGYEIIWASTEAYVGKILHIAAGESLSVQYHNMKDETVYLLSGELHYRIWENGEPRVVPLAMGEAFRVTPGTIHQMEAVTDCDVLEVSTPHLDDVVRLSDRYGREGTSAP